VLELPPVEGEPAPAQAPAPAPPDRSARLGAAIAGVSGVLLVISLFLHWYAVPAAEFAEGVGGVFQDIGDAVGIDVGDRIQENIYLTGWEAFEVTDVICCAAAAVAVIRAFVAILGESDNPSIPGSLLTAVLGGVALALILYRTINPPYVALDRELGLWVGLFAAGGIVYGSYTALRADRAEHAASGGGGGA
jgi:hypothetical protein